MKIVAVSLIDAVYREHGYIFIDKGLRKGDFFFFGVISMRNLNSF